MNINSTYLICNPTKYIFVVLLNILLCGAGRVNAITYYSRATANWAVNTTWSTVSYVSAVNTGAYPVAGDVAMIGGGFTVSTNGNQACSGITITSILSMANGNILTVDGDVTGAGTWTTGAGVRTISLTGNWSFNGTSTGAGATAIFTGAANQSLTGKISTGGGALTINKSSGSVTLGNAITVTTFTNTAGTFDPATNLLTATTRTFTAGTLRVGGATWGTNYSGAITEPAAGIIEYYAGAQTVNNITYPGHLVLSGAGTKTLGATTTTITGNFTLSGTASATTVANLAVGGNLDVGSGTTFATGTNFTLGVTGTSNISGTLTLAGTGAKTFTGDVSVNSGGVWNETGVAAIGFAGNLTNNATTFTANTGVHTFSGAAKIISGSTETSIPSVTISGTTANNGTLTVSTTLAGGSTLTNAATGTLNFGGASITPTLTATAGGSTVNYNRTNIQTVKPTTYSNLILSGTSAKTTTGITVTGVLSMEGDGTVTASALPTYGGSSSLQYKGGGAQTTGTEFPATFTGAGGVIVNNSSGVVLGAAKSISSILTLTNGILATSSGNLLSITNTATTAISGGSTTSFINGPIKWSLPNAASGTYNFPVGKGTTYLPFSLVSPTTTGATTAQVEAFAIGSGGSADATTLTSISTSEYWSWITAANFTSSSVSLTRQTAITPLDAVGSSTTLTGTYTTLDGTAGINGVSNSNAIGGTNRFFVLAKGKPTITTSTATLSGFSYFFGYGPSSIQSFTVGGTRLTTNITVLPSTDFEISLTSGASFAAQSIITLNVNNGTVATTTIYVRMKAGLVVGSYPITTDNVTCQSTDATTMNVACSGTVNNTPTINVSPTPLTLFSYNLGAGPSAEQSFTVSGINLSANIIITPPVNFEISTGTGGSFLATNPITLIPSSGTVSTTTIYVRLKAGVGAGTYSPVNVTLTSTNAVTQNVACSATVYAPTINPSTGTLAGFIYTVGSGPSGVQTFTIGAINLIANLTLAPPANFEISTTIGSGYVTSPSTLSLTPTGGTVSTTTIYARMKSGLNAASYGSSNIVMSSTGAISPNVSLSGQVIAVGSPTILLSKSSLNGFAYLYNAGSGGPSIEQSFTVSGASLTASIIITAPTNFQISTGSGVSFVATNPITLSGATINATTIYIRLVSGLAVGSYGPINLTTTSTGATQKNISCSGTVITDPTIGITNGTPISTCDGSALTLVSSGTASNKYWEGPNGTYSNDVSQNWNLGNVTYSPINMSGTYTVTGSALSGVNLVTNGDFAAGNTGFGSSYIFRDSTYSNPPNTPYGALSVESNYTVVSKPKTVHTLFATCGDHSTGHGLQMVVNGAGIAGVVIWSQSIAVVPSTTYQFSYWVQSVYPLAPSQLQLYINGVSAGPVYTAELDTCIWKKFTYNVNTGSSTVANLTLINQNTATSGNDFALDDINFQQVFPVSTSTVLTVNPNLPAGVSITASSNPIYAGDPVTFTATPTNGGSSPTYQWKVNGVNQGTNSPTFNYTPAIGEQILCVMTSNATCVTGSPVTSTSLTAVANSNFWMGAVGSKDWGTASNWTANAIPLPGKDVIYATVANYGIAAVNDLQLDQDRTIGSLINNTTNRALIIPAGKGLIVNNTITTDNNPDHIYIYSDPSQTNGSLIFHNTNSYVLATVEMYSKASISMTYADSVAQTRYKWQYFGIPLRSVVANPTFSGSYIRDWHETGTTIYNHWLSLNNQSTLNPFYGYEICQPSPTKIYFKGELVNSNFNSGQLTKTTAALFPGQHIFANPYTSAIDIRQLTFGSDMEATVYLYNTGAYGTWLSAGGSYVSDYTPGQYISIPQATAGQSGIPVQVSSMGAMLVRVLNSTANATLGITYNSVAMNNSVLQRASSGNSDVSISDKVVTMIVVKSENHSDRMWIFTDPTCTRGFDNGKDGQKMLGSALNPQLYAIETDGNYQVNSVADMHDTELAFLAGEDVEDTLIFSHQNIEKSYAGVYLLDLVENKTIDITLSGTKYNFRAESTPTPIKRFRIVTRHYEKDATDAETQVKIFSSQGTILIQNFSNVDGNCQIYDIAGHYLKNVTFEANGVTSIAHTLMPGAYIATAITSNEKISKRLIVR